MGYAKHLKIKAGILPEEVKDLRNSLEISQAKFAAGLDIPLRTYVDTELGLKKPTHAMVSLLKHVSKCPAYKKHLKKS